MEITSCLGQHRGALDACLHLRYIHMHFSTVTYCRKRFEYFLFIVILAGEREEFASIVTRLLNIASNRRATHARDEDCSWNFCLCFVVTNLMACVIEIFKSATVTNKTLFCYLFFSDISKCSTI